MEIEKINQLFNTESFENISLALQIGKNHSNDEVREYTLKKERELIREYLEHGQVINKQVFALKLMDESEQDLKYEMSLFISSKFEIFEEENPVNINISLGINKNKTILKKPFVTPFRLDKSFFETYPETRTYKITPTGILDTGSRALIKKLLSNKKKKYIEIEGVVFEGGQFKLVTDTGVKILLEQRVLTIFEKDNNPYLFCNKRLDNLLKNIAI